MSGRAEAAGLYSVCQRLIAKETIQLYQLYVCVRVCVFAWDKSVKHIYDAEDSEIKFYYMDPFGPQNKDRLFYKT